METESLSQGFMIGRVKHPAALAGLRELFMVDMAARGDGALLRSGAPVRLTGDEVADLQDPSTTTFIAYDFAADVVIGHVSLHRVTTLPRGRTAEVDMVVTRPGYDRRGIGQAVMEIAIREAQHELKCRGLFLNSNPIRQAARSLYVKLGFTLRSGNRFELSLPWQRPHELLRPAFSGLDREDNGGLWHQPRDRQFAIRQFCGLLHHTTQIVEPLAWCEYRV